MFGPISCVVLVVVVSYEAMNTLSGGNQLQHVQNHKNLREKRNEIVFPFLRFGLVCFALLHLSFFWQWVWGKFFLLFDFHFHNFPDLGYGVGWLHGAWNDGAPGNLGCLGRFAISLNICKSVCWLFSSDCKC